MLKNQLKERQEEIPEARDIKISKKEIEILSDYFWGCRIWCHYDLVIFGNTSNLLNSASIVVISNEIIKMIDFLYKKGTVYVDYMRTLMNNIDIFWCRKEYDLCKEFIKKCRPYLKNEFFFELSFFKVYQNLLDYLDSHNIEYIKEIETVIDYVVLIDQDDYANHYKKLIENIKI